MRPAQTQPIPNPLSNSRALLNLRRSLSALYPTSLPRHSSLNTWTHPRHQTDPVMHLATTEAFRSCSWDRCAYPRPVCDSGCHSLLLPPLRQKNIPTQSHPKAKPWILEIYCTSHVLQNLRYIQSTTDVSLMLRNFKVQASLNLSLARALHVHGDHTALLADAGIPRLTLIQDTHLALMHFRLTKRRTDTLPAMLFKTFNKSPTLSNLHPSTRLPHPELTPPAPY